MRLKISITCLAVVLMYSISIGQGSFPRGNKIPEYKSMFGSAGFGVSGSGIPIYAGLEYVVFKNISIGGQLGFNLNSVFANSSKDNSFSIVGRCNYNFNKILRLRAPWYVYGGGTLGFISDGVADVFLGLQAGCTYFLNSHMALNGEIGIGSIYGLKIGINYLW